MPAVPLPLPLLLQTRARRAAMVTRLFQRKVVGMSANSAVGEGMRSSQAQPTPPRVRQLRLLALRGPTLGDRLPTLLLMLRPPMLPSQKAAPSTSRHPRRMHLATQGAAASQA